MSKRTKSLIAAAVALVIVAGLLVAVKIFLPENKDPVESSTETNYVALFQVAAEDVTKVDIDHPDAGFVAEYNGSEYTIQGLEGLPLDTDTLKSVFTQASSFLAKELVEENSANLAMYGLDKPRYTVTVTTKSGEPFVIEFGLSSSNTYTTYAKVAGSSDVYTFYESDINHFSSTKESFVSRSIVPTLAESVELKSLSYTGKEYAEPFVLAAYNFDTLGPNKYSYFTYAITSPKLRPVDAEMLLTQLEKISGTTASDVLIGNYDEEILSQYGLDDPDTIIELVVTEEYEADDVYTFQLSYQDGKVYAICNDVPIIYTLVKQDWMQLQYSDCVHSLFVLPYISKVSNVTVETDGKSYSFDIAGEDSEEITYKNTSLEKAAFTKYYQLLIGASHDGNYVPDTQVDEAAVLKITYTYRDGSEADVIEFYPATTRRMYVAVNGEIEFTMLSSYLEKVQQASEQIVRGEAVNPDWKL